MIEMHRKFTLSFACIIFFFIGAPLGAIIRKGGLGTPLVISVFLFIVYYIIDNSGYKMARDAKIETWEGIWLSSAVLFPLGLFFTYKAVNDSAVFNLDAYKNFFARLTGRRHRELELKEIVMDPVNVEKAIESLNNFDEDLKLADSKLSKNKLLRSSCRFTSWSKQGKELDLQLNRIVEHLANTTSQSIITVVNKYPYAIYPSNIDEIRKVNKQLLFLLEKSVDSTNYQV